uniref:WW domain-containing protein n=1 Tax=Fagus sylvatica TaxID=28930 RepID=A0A2N9J9K9_FAGSY
MDFPELSLAPTQLVVNKSTISSSPESDSNPSRKRKFFNDHQLKTEQAVHTSVDLQLKDPLPLDWEQCLDLGSGKMYYLNRKTLRKSWDWPKDHKLDLELNISTHSTSSEQCSSNSDTLEDSKKYSTNSNMIALACLNCHLLVILSKSSPSCPNCKYVHSLPSQQTPPAKVPVVKSLNTLSLLN